MATSKEREWWSGGESLERWLLETNIARPNGAPGRLELTEFGAELVALVAQLDYQ
jgi:hypothetical protein